MNTNDFPTAPFAIGKYLVSPLSRCIAADHHLASVSIRSGRGSATTDRVLRFVPAFATAALASSYASAEGAAWVRRMRMPGVSSAACVGAAA